MGRIHCRELHERPGCPGIFRDGLTDFLSFLAAYSGIYAPAEKMLARLLDQSVSPLLYTDLCAGAGFYELYFARRLSGRSGRVAKVRLTDLFPNANWPELARIAPDKIEFVADSCPAETALERYPGLHVMFSSLHHFEPSEVAGLLKCAARNRRTLVMFDYSQRNFWASLPPMLLGPFFMYAVSFLVWPFSWKRLFWTNVLPVLPVLLAIDGVLSQLRAYTPTELAQMAENAGLPPDCRTEAGELPIFGGRGKVGYLLVEPLTSK